MNMIFEISTSAAMKQFSIVLLQWYSWDGYFLSLPTCTARKEAILHVIIALRMAQFLAMMKDAYSYLIFESLSYL
jgi:hypothetical protein